MEGKIPSAIAADLREGPLSRARETAAEYGCGDRMAFRLCDGLSGIRPEETDAVVIAGMGGGDHRPDPGGGSLGADPKGSAGAPAHELPAGAAAAAEGGEFHILEERLAREGTPSML